MRSRSAPSVPLASIAASKASAHSRLARLATLRSSIQILSGRSSRSYSPARERTRRWRDERSTDGWQQRSTVEGSCSMAAKALLVLEDGSVFRGKAFGAPVRSHGEVVFSTAMTGYQEMLTDPSFAGQVLVLTYPLAGNYGIDRETVESKRIQVRSLIVHETCEIPSHWGSEMTLHEYLASQDIPAVASVDTRALT